MNRRSFLTLGATFLAAPAILRVITLDALPQYETVETFTWYFDAHGGSGQDRWSMRGATVATDYDSAYKAFGPACRALGDGNVPREYFAMGRRDDSRRLITRRRERIIV